jgi:hypothetical protein
MRETGTLIEKDAGDTFTVSFYDVDGEATTPATVHYRVDCMTNSTQIRDWAEVTAGSSVTITLTSTDTAIVDDDNEEELRRLTVCADKDNTASQKTDHADFFVLNSKRFVPAT